MMFMQKSRTETRKERLKKKKQTFTKKAVKVILFFSILDLQLSYVLAFLGREQIAETLSITVVTEIVAVMLGYFLKSFKETKEEEKLCYLRECKANTPDIQRQEQEQGQTAADNVYCENPVE